MTDICPVCSLPFKKGFGMRKDGAWKKPICLDCFSMALKRGIINLEESSK